MSRTWFRLGAVGLVIALIFGSVITGNMFPGKNPIIYLFLLLGLAI